MRVIAIIDPDHARAKNVLNTKQSSLAKHSYADTALYKDTSGYSGVDPDAVFIGTPPAFRGTMIAGRDVEAAASKKFSSSALFVEKPISSSPLPYVLPLIPYFKERKTLVAVGYMLRYLKGFDQIKLL